MPNLDGTEQIKPTPYDAHEQAQAEAAEGYEHQEYPKAVDHVDHPSGVGQEPILVKDADEEAAFKEAKAPAPATE